MTRFLLNSKGEPIPLEAMPPLSPNDTLPVQRLVLDETGFDKRDYVALGYTHFEVFCIGAAGGYGGAADGVGGYTPGPGDTYPGLPGVYSTGGGIYSWPYRYSPKPSGGMLTHWYNPFLDPSAWGGGGGGGGMHRVAGQLVDLPDISPVIVGQAGADAPVGHLHKPGPYTPAPPSFGVFPTANDVYDPPIITFDIPKPGGDGGYSSFAGGLCAASGGKGGGLAAPPGDPGTYEAPRSYWWRQVPYQGYGGEGGRGNRTAAGGGAAGSTTLASGQDGMWDGDIGSGGGGGRGSLSINEFYATSPQDNYKVTRAATSGGQGSYSYGDPSMYGSRELASGTTMPGGSGGGARMGTLKHGSRAPGFDPNGLVVIRISKID